MENNAKAAAVRNLTNKLGRKPLAAEVAGLLKTRKQKRNEGAFFKNIMAAAAVKEAGKEALKAAKKAAGDEVKAKLKAETNAQKAIKKAERNEERAFQKAMKAQVAAVKKVNNPNNSKAARRTAKAELKAVQQRNVALRKTARAEKKAVKLEAKEKAKVQFALAESRARNNLARTLGKAPQMANIKRLAGIRTSGVNLSTNDYMRVKKYRNTLKAKGSLNKLYRENVRNVVPDIDVCAQCELKKFLERED
jgi:hypothetical protein